MKRTLYISGIVIFITVLIALFFFIRYYNKPHANMHKTMADYAVTVDNLVNEFIEDETRANQKYLGKVIQLEGTVKRIDSTNGNTIITIRSNSPISNVICHMNPSENKKTLQIQEGQKIKVKGVCTGFLMDVALVRTIIVN